MQGDEHSESLAATPAARRLAHTVAAAWLTFCVVLVWYGSTGDGNRTSLFVTPDIALVCLIGILPFSLLLWQLLGGLLGTVAPTALGGLCWMGALVAIMLLPAVRSTSSPFLGIVGYVGRPVVALLLLAPSALAWTCLRPPAAMPDARRWGWFVTTGILAVALPATYVAARCRQDAISFQELRAQSRLGEAARVIHRLQRLSLSSQLQGQPIPRLMADMDRSVRQLQSAVAGTLPVGATDDDRLQRARQLAILGQPYDALEILDTVRTSRPDVDNLSATIHENLGHWQQALDEYTRAETSWESLPSSQQQVAGRIQAVTGMAFCLRKQGRYPEAEQIYLQLLALSPTAQTHYLLAQFYEDTQQSSLARQHVLQAIELAPKQFERPGRQLINKLAASHFGCFNMSLNTSE